mgnify:CR=1 FL=1
MPKIPTYTRQINHSGANQNVPMDNTMLNTAGAMGKAVKGFASLIEKQAEDLRQRDIAIEKVELSNKAREYYITQQTNYENNANKSQSVLQLD